MRKFGEWNLKLPIRVIFVGLHYNFNGILGLFFWKKSAYVEGKIVPIVALTFGL